MNPIPRVCPFCQHSFGTAHGCKCTYVYEVYGEDSTHKLPFYDLYINIGTTNYIFGSGHGGWTRLSIRRGRYGSDVIAEINSYTEPTIENITQTAQRLLKLKAFA